MHFDLHHLSKRKRLFKKFEKYPSDKKFIRFLDRLLIIIAVVGPIMAIPQLYQVYFYQNAAGISALSWFSWAAMNLIWLTYGFVHKEKPIIITYILWFIVNMMMAVAPFIF